MEWSGVEWEGESGRGRQRRLLEASSGALPLRRRLQAERAQHVGARGEHLGSKELRVLEADAPSPPAIAGLDEGSLASPAATLLGGGARVREVVREVSDRPRPHRLHLRLRRRLRPCHRIQCLLRWLYRPIARRLRFATPLPAASMPALLPPLPLTAAGCARGMARGAGRGGESGGEWGGGGGGLRPPLRRRRRRHRLLLRLLLLLLLLLRRRLRRHIDRPRVRHRRLHRRVEEAEVTGLPARIGLRSEAAGVAPLPL